MPKTIPMYTIATLLALVTVHIFSSLFATMQLPIPAHYYAAATVIFVLCATDFVKAVYKGEE